MAMKTITQIKQDWDYCNEPVYRVAKPRKNEWGEWVTVVYRYGRRDEGKTNYTDDKEDAFGTTENDIIPWANKENERLREKHCRMGE